MMFIEVQKFESQTSETWTWSLLTFAKNHRNLGGESSKTASTPLGIPSPAPQASWLPGHLGWCWRRYQWPCQRALGRSSMAPGAFYPKGKKKSIEVNGLNTYGFLGCRCSSAHCSKIFKFCQPVRAAKNAYKANQSLPESQAKEAFKTWIAHQK